MNSAELVNIDKVEALEQIRVLAEVGQSLRSPLMKKIARTAVKILRGTISPLASNSALAEVNDRTLPVVLQHFDLN
ncbi:MAG: hypothetical protein AAF609_25825 [Cyanobacteria bacterium P01_C01_bin.120]